ncbi:MAG: translesion error-prone DNA polymerase V autoproteolytic subunit [Planctomycetia bacterium]|nr:translesion error-prone DNA polymerase V autoproteolytic subunit [Planctomycetia bacterium]
MPRGGRRKGAGRPKGTGKFGVPTKAIRVPEAMVDQIINFIHRKGDIYPLYGNMVPAGFPAVTEGAPAEMLDLNAWLIQNPASTFFVRATGDSMIGAGIFADDVLVVDKSVEPQNGDIVIAVLNNEFTVKRLEKTDTHVELKSENPDYPSIIIPEDTELQIWGVVKHSLRTM